MYFSINLRYNDTEDRVTCSITHRNTLFEATATGGKNNEVDAISYALIMLNERFGDEQGGVRVPLDGVVFPSTERTIVSLPQGDSFNGAHNYSIKPMLRYENGAVCGLEGMPLTFVKQVPLEGGGVRWQAGVQSEQLLLVLLDRHEKMNAVFASDVHDEFMGHIAGALECLERRFRNRMDRGVAGQQKA